MLDKFYITTPIYYVNDKPHIGHSYTTIAADVLARYYRQKGSNVMFLTGTDEHGVKVAQSAEKNKMEPKEFCDWKSGEFKKAWEALNISNDYFIRTTDEKHERLASVFLQKLFDKGLIYKGIYKGLYCVGCESYKIESDLVDGLCPDHQKAPTELEEENYFFKLSEYNDRLKDMIEKDESKVRPESRKNEVLGLLKEGLKDIAISRVNVPWGIPLPFDKEQTAYVWIEALMNYVTAIDIFENEENFKTWWPADIQLMAKDIIKFHALIWPAMLMGLDLDVPKQVFAHGFFTIDGQKMSKTVGNVIDPMEISEKYGADAVRYFLLSEFPFGSDGDISVARFDERHRSDLSNGIGNLVSRVFAMAAKQEKIKFNYNNDFKNETEKFWEFYHENIAKLKFHEVLAEVRKYIAMCDRYVEDNKPWELSKSDPEKLEQVLSNLIEAIRHVAWAIKPFMPDTGNKILVHLGENPEQAYEVVNKWGNLSEEKEIQKISPLFPRMEE